MMQPPLQLLLVLVALGRPSQGQYDQDQEESSELSDRGLEVKNIHSSRRSLMNKLGLAAGGLAGGLLAGHLVRVGMHQGIEAAKDLMKTHPPHGDGEVNIKPESSLGGIAGHSVNTMLGYVPYVPNSVKGGVAHAAQTLGDKLTAGASEAIQPHIIQDVLNVKDVFMNLFGSWGADEASTTPETTTTVSSSTSTSTRAPPVRKGRPPNFGRKKNRTTRRPMMDLW